MMLRALGGAVGVALLGEVLPRHLSGGFVPALADLFTAAALAALPACAAARAPPWPERPTDGPVDARDRPRRAANGWSHGPVARHRQPRQ